MTLRTLLTGASGFIGGHFMDAMGGTALPSHVDIRDVDALTATLADLRPDAVIHLAAQSSVAESITDPLGTLQTNFLGTLNILEALEKSGFRGRLLFGGSGDCYGRVDETDLPVTESQPLRPRNPYAVSKVAAEALCYQWSQTHEFEIIMVRPFNQIGPRQSTDFVVSDLGMQCSAIRRGRRPAEVTVGDCEVTRDFTDVRDGVRAFAALIEHGRNGETYNVCSGIERSIREIIEGYSDIIGTPVAIRQDAARLRRTEQRRMRGSFAKLQEHTGWKPEIPLRQTLSDIIEYWDGKETP